MQCALAVAVVVVHLLRLVLVVALEDSLLVGLLLLILAQ
jgi:hypothetical protein